MGCANGFAHTASVKLRASGQQRLPTGKGFLNRYKLLFRFEVRLVCAERWVSALVKDGSATAEIAWIDAQPCSSRYEIAPSSGLSVDTTSFTGPSCTCGRHKILTVSRPLPILMVQSQQTRNIDAYPHTPLQMRMPAHSFRFFVL